MNGWSYDLQTWWPTAGLHGHVHFLVVHLVSDPTIRQPGFDLPRQQWSLLNRFRMVQGHCGACRRKWRLTDNDLCPCGETQTMSHAHCWILSFWQNWMAVYPGCTLQMKTLFPGWPIMVHDTHTRRRRNLDETYVYTFITGNSTWPLLCVGCHVGLYSSFISCPTIVVVSIRD